MNQELEFDENLKEKNLSRAGIIELEEYWQATSKK